MRRATGARINGRRTIGNSGHRETNHEPATRKYSLEHATGAIAADFSVALVLPHYEIEASSTTSVDVVVLNSDSGPIDVDIPENIVASLADGQREWTVDLRAGASGKSTIAPNGFLRQRFVFTVPPEPSGHMQLEVRAPLPARGALVVERTGRASKSSSGSGAFGDTATMEFPSLADVERAFGRHFAFHHPVYFLYGADAPAAKFQFSFKYRLFGEDGMLGNLQHPSPALYFGYTQRSLSNISACRSPSPASSATIGRRVRFRWT